MEGVIVQEGAEFKDATTAMSMNNFIPGLYGSTLLKSFISFSKVTGFYYHSILLELE